MKVRGAGLRPHAPPRLFGYVHVFQMVFAIVEEVREAVATAVPSQRKFSTGTRAYVTSVAFPKFKEIKDVAKDRLENVEGAGDLRNLFGVNAAVNEDAPMDVYTGLVKQQKACTDPDFARLLGGRELYPEVWAAELVPIVDTLRTSIHGGVTGDTVRADANARLQSSLVLIDITLSRAGSFLNTWAGSQFRDRLLAEVPHKHQKGGRAGRSRRAGAVARRAGRGGGAAADRGGRDAEDGVGQG